ncbi:hypothetical protein HOB30_01800, partial [Candidatus Falkowbacteria bacterium]|nr:hypothetical protein [Candidatus Falkowbacteria bacterium]
MKKNIYTSIKDLAQLTQFIFTSQSMYTKASPQVIGFLLSTYFDDSSRLLTITDNDEKILACATLTFPERYPEVAFLGNYELPVNTLNRSAIKKELFSLIENVAKENHITKIIGPINFNTWLGNRFKTSTTNKDYAWEPLNPKEYVDDFTSEDFSKDMEYITNYYKDSNRLFATTEEK